MKKFGNLWSTEEDQFLLENYEKGGIKFCKEHLNRTDRAIRQRAKKYNIRVNDDVRYKNQRKYKKEEIENTVKNSVCIADICRYFNQKPYAGNYTNFKKIILFYNIDTSHFLNPSELGKLRKTTSNNGMKKVITDYLVKGIFGSSKNIKKRLYEEGIKTRECELCGQDENWRGNHMSLILDHINGDNSDNRLENLRIVCPNCNATLDTHCSKNRKKIKNTNNLQNKKIERIPILSVLLEDFKKLKTFTNVGKKYGISDNGVRRWCKKYNILDKVKNIGV